MELGGGLPQSLSSPPTWRGAREDAAVVVWRRSVCLRFLIALGLGVPMLGPARLAAMAAQMPLVTCQPGEELLSPSSSTVSSDGWVVQSYVTDEGLSFDRRIPPVGFDPTNVDQTYLSQHGFSKNVADHWTSGTHVSRVAGFCRSRTASSAGAGGQSGFSQHWAGNLVTQAGTIDAPSTTKTPYRSVTGIWKLTKYANCDGGSSLASWVGLGGWHKNGQTNNHLIQAGVVQWPPSSYYPAGHPLQAFWEIIWGPGANDDSHVVNLSVKPKSTDRMFAEVDVDPDAGSAAFWVSDMTTGDSDNAFVPSDKRTPPSVTPGRIQTAYDGSTAEWIDERPYLAYLPGLANFGFDNWQQMRTSLDGSTFKGGHNSTWWPIKMTSNGTSTGSKLASGGGIASDDTAMTQWFACS